MSRGKRFDARKSFGRDGVEALEREQLDHPVRYFEENVGFLGYLGARVEQA
jgi:hypothetical protein